MAKKSFTASFDLFEKTTWEDALYIETQAIQDVMEGMQTPQKGIGQGATGFEVGKIPVDEAELINSLTSNGIEGEESYVSAIANHQVGGSITFSYTAEHAYPMEVGTEKMDGRHFMGYNVAKFVGYIEKYVKEVQG